jgi:hypothetical protein
MVRYKTTIRKFDEKGEKTGWTYVELPEDVISQLNPGTRKIFRVKGLLDRFAIHQVAVMPMGDGTFILPINADMRKGTGKRKGAMLDVQLSVDDSPVLPSGDMMECLELEPKALEFFKSLTLSHQNYFSKWIASAKTPETKARRIANMINAMLKKQGYPEMIRSLKADKNR